MSGAPFRNRGSLSDLDRPARPEVVGTFGVVSSSHWAASAIGMSMLERGGNAVDAAAATGFALQVLEPHRHGPGGEVPVILSLTTEDKPIVVSGQGPTPATATLEAFANAGVAPTIPGKGLLPACVPAVFGTWMSLLRRFGRMSVRDVLEPAIGLAADGFRIPDSMVQKLESCRELFLTEWVDSGSVYLPGGKLPTVGERVSNGQVAATYRRILEEAGSAGSRDTQIDRAFDAFYKGFVAEEIDQYVATTEVWDESGERHRGFLTGEDLASYEVRFEQPAELNYRGFQVLKPGPWSQGPVFLQQLAMLRGFDIGELDPMGLEFLHLITECSKLAFADREAWYGDPSDVEVPLDSLLSEEYAVDRRRLVSREASFEIRPGSPGGHTPRLPSVAPITSGANGTGDTVHVAVADRFGNLVSATASGGWLQDSPVIPSLGFCLGTRAQSMWLEAGLPNSLGPSKRPRTTLSPTLVLRDGDPYLAFGTPGGDQQDQWTLLFFLYHTEFGCDLQAAADGPMFHLDHAWSSFAPRSRRPGVLTMEDRYDGSVVSQLREAGHVIELAEPWSAGWTTAVARDSSGFLRAGASSRPDFECYAVGR